MDFKKLLGDTYKEDMTNDELVEALKNVELEDTEKLRNAISKANKEASEYKKQLQQFKTEEQLNKEREDEEKKTLQENYNKLLKENTVSKYTNEFLELGFSKEHAVKSAKALYENDSTKLFDYIKENNKVLEANIRSKVIDETPRPKTDSNSSAITLEEFRKLSVEERAKFSKENPTEYKKLYEGE